MEKSTKDGENLAGLRAASALMRIPQLQRLLERPEAQQLCTTFQREEAVAVIREEVARARRAIRAGDGAVPDFGSAAFFGTVRDELERRRRHNLVRVINATGVVLHTNLGRAPLAPEALCALQEVGAGYSNLEFDLERGERGSRYAHVEELLCRLTGSEAALVVNNCAAAVLLCLMALARGGDVLVSRGELIEIGGSFRMPDVIAQSGAQLVEVGATNKTRLGDYEKAIGENTRMILKSHPSNYRIVGFCASPERSELARLAREHKLVMVEDLGSGTLADLRRYGLPHEPTVQECVRAGADVITFSGDKLLGGPQAGIIVGRKEHIGMLKQHPLLRALRIDKLSLCALEATLMLYQLPAPPEQHIPVLRMLAEGKPSIGRRARRLARLLARVDGLDCRVEEGISLPGGGSLPETGLPTFLVRVRVDGWSADALARQLRRQRPALIGRIADDSFTMDMRTVAPREVAEIVQAIARAIA